MGITIKLTERQKQELIAWLNSELEKGDSSRRVEIINLLNKLQETKMPVYRRAKRIKGWVPLLD